MKKFNKILKIGCILMGAGVALALLICIISLLSYGTVFFFDGYVITAFAWIVVIQATLAGCIMTIIGGIRYFKNISKDVVASSETVLENSKTTASQTGAKYFVDGARGRMLAVYEDKVVISTRVTAGSIIVGNATDGEKTIYYSDCIGLQFKKSQMTLGYIQFETASGIMNNKSSNMFNENSFTWDAGKTSNELMEEIAAYVKGRIDEYKRSKSNTYVASSSADELKKYKKLFDEGIITQEEFDAKKKQLLGL